MNLLKPEDFIPDWNDSERINFLYSAFPDDRELNAHHFDSKLLLWKNIIENIFTSPSYKYCYFNWNSLCEFLMKNGKEPLGLGTVYDDMLKSNKIINLSVYLQDLEVHESWLGWGLNYVKKPSKWVLNKVLSPLKSRRNFKETLILPTAVKIKSQVIMEKINDMPNDLLSKEHHYANMNIYLHSELIEILSDVVSDYQSLDIILAYLKSQGKVVTFVSENNDAGCTYIKFVRKCETKVSPINEANIGCINLYKTKTSLENSIHQSYHQIKEVTQHAKEYKKMDKKVLALNMMRKRHRLQEIIQNHEKSLSNVEKLLESIAQCKNDKLIMEAYKSGIKAHQDISTGMSLDEIEKTRSDMEDIFDIQKDISDAVSSPLVDDNSFDKTLLEQELKELLNEEEAGETDYLTETLEKLSIKDVDFDSKSSAELNSNLGDIINLPTAPTASPIRQKLVLTS